jgi:serine/threonine-protein kinase
MNALQTACADSWVGSKIGAYDLESILGCGGVAVVYATRLHRTIPAALKMLTKAAGQDAHARDAFQREFHLASRLKHPNIVPMLATGQAAERPYILMGLVDGHSLTARLRGGPRLEQAEALRIAVQMADTLDYVHERGIVHRDVKPSNILITRDGRALLCDFGAALDMNAAEGETGKLYGTPAYLAPEQAAGAADIDGRADLYALGLVLYRMVAGRLPFYGTRLDLLHAHIHETPPRPSRFARLAPELDELICQAIAKDPDQRFQSGAEMARALAAIEPVAPCRYCFLEQTVTRVRWLLKAA